MIQPMCIRGRAGIPCATLLLMLALAGCMPPTVKDTPPAAAAAVTSATAPPETAHSTIGNTAAELQRLMTTKGLTEMRTTYNGKYGASLLLHADSLEYYVVLFHDNQFWRVIRTDQHEEAETAYRTFVSQTEELAQVQLDAQRLEASKRYAEKLVAENEKRLRGIQNEMAQQQQQAAAVSQAIEINRQQALALSGELRSTHNQLENLQNQIRILQAQHKDPQLTLPHGNVTTLPHEPVSRLSGDDTDKLPPGIPQSSD